MCCELLWDVPLELLEVLHETAAMVVEQEGKKDLLYWNRVAQKVDRNARLWIPGAYYSILILLVNVDFRDDYSRPPTSAANIQTTGALSSGMFEGIGVTYFTAANVVLIMLVPIILILLVISMCVLMRIARKRQIIGGAPPSSRTSVRRSSDTLVTAVSSRMSGRFDEKGKVEDFN